MSGKALVRRRVAARFAAIVLAAVLVAALALRQLVADALEREFRGSQDGIGALVHAFFRAEVPEYKSVEATLDHLAAEHDFAQSHVRFRRPDGATYLAGGAARRPEAPLAAPVWPASYPLDAALAPGWTVEVETSAAGLEASRRRLDAWLALTALGAALVALVAGWLVTGTALAPVRAMTEAAGRLGPAAPGARLPVADARDELGRLGARFNALLERLEGALDQQRRFLAVAAHELRTPIARLRSEAEVARLDGGEAGPALERMERDLAGIAAMLDQLLQLARADAQPDAVRPAPASLDDLVADAVERWRVPARRRGVALELGALDEARAALDAPYAARLVDVLLDNALRYTPAGGRVTVSVAGDVGGAVLTVADTGPGIPAGDRPRAFERFWRGDEARRIAPEGSGLGLALAQWIATAHGAVIELGDAPGGGTTACVRFPLMTG